MKVHIGLTVATAIAAFGLLATPASAKSFWDQLNDTAPRSDGVFGDLQNAAPRSPFDQINSTAPRAPFDQINDTAPVRAPDTDLAGE